MPLSKSKDNMDDAHGFQEFLKKNVGMCENVCTVLSHCFPQTTPRGYETRTPAFKSTLEISLSSNRTSKDTRCTVAPCCYKCAQKISRQGTISPLFRTDNIFKRMWPDTLIP